MHTVIMLYMLQIGERDFTKHNISIGFTDDFFVLTFGLFFFSRQISTDFFCFPEFKFKKFMCDSFLGRFSQFGQFMTTNALYISRY